MKVFWYWGDHLDWWRLWGVHVGKVFIGISRAQPTQGWTLDKLDKLAAQRVRDASPDA